VKSAKRPDPDFRVLFLEPRSHAEPVCADAKQVCWNKAKLRRSQCNCTDDQAVDRRDKEYDPGFSRKNYRWQDGEDTRKIVQMEHREIGPPIEASPDSGELAICNFLICIPFTMTEPSSERCATG
jgi:hypothetical protein